jgi:hypothetical protein
VTVGGAHSPIHNHGNACAVINVLHGDIQVDVHNKLEVQMAPGVSLPPSALQRQFYAYLNP